MQEQKTTTYILGDSATQLFTKSLKKQTKKSTIKHHFIEADYNQIERQILDLSSPLYESTPDFIIVYRHTHKLLNKFAKTTNSQKSSFATEQIKNDEQLLQTIQNKLPNARILLCNYYEIQDPSFGNFASKSNQSFLYQLRKLNYEQMNLAQQFSNTFNIDLNALVHFYGSTESFDARMRILADMPLSMEIQSKLAQQVLKVMNTIQGRFKKCLILDLDNTLWGGIIGDDGLENIQIGELGLGKAFTAVQQYAKLLKDRGIILCICSKNTESIAKEAFEKHPDMLLALDDIAVFMANWENKVENIMRIQQILNIGFDSMVFVDDNPFERNLVRESIPEITVPELPEDPADYVPFLINQNLFETAITTKDDAKRTQQYKAEAERVESKKTFLNEDDFLKNLHMVSEVKAFDKFSIPRVAQLSQRSNQFNLRTKRYTEADIENIRANNAYETMTFSLEDKYGEHGLISLIILKKEGNTLFIDTWIMSCRVLKRGMELFVLNQIITFAHKNGFKKIIGEYIPTLKNRIVENHYKDLGFTQNDQFWELMVNEYQKKTTHIKKKKQ